jgi:hypothetical protein
MATTKDIERSLAAQLAAHESWAATDNPSARTAPARAAFERRFLLAVDPDGVLLPEERARRAEHKRKAYFARLALLSAQARRNAPATTPPVADAQCSTDAPRYTRGEGAST